MLHTCSEGVPTVAPRSAMPASRSPKGQRKAQAHLALKAPAKSASQDVDGLVDLTLPQERAADPSPGLRWLDLDTAAREALRARLQDRMAAYLRRGRPRIIVTDNVHTMVSIKRGDGVVTFRLHHMFLDAPSVILRALARYAEGQDRASARLLRQYIDANDRRVRRSPERPIPLDVQGKYYNLQEIFDALNARYFEGRIRARITWGQRGRRRRSRESIKLGSYTFEDELIRIHPVLDAADVPRFFVEWIVYHEMLHQVHPIRVVNGRRQFHSRDFLEDEAKFAHYAAAREWERAHLDELLTY